jgi:hypothetical protein
VDRGADVCVAVETAAIVEDYESLCDTSEAMVHIAMIRLMLQN